MFEYYRILESIRLAGVTGKKGLFINTGHVFNFLEKTNSWPRYLRFDHFDHLTDPAIKNMDTLIVRNINFFKTVSNISFSCLNFTSMTSLNLKQTFLLLYKKLNDYSDFTYFVPMLQYWKTLK